jgi:hypothetical protein
VIKFDERNRRASSGTWKWLVVDTLLFFTSVAELPITPASGIDQRTAATVALCLLQRGSITASADVLTKMIRARSKIAGSHTTASKRSATKMASLSTSPKIVQNPD